VVAMDIRDQVLEADLYINLVPANNGQYTGSIHFLAPVIYSQSICCQHWELH
jgi:hypothetical protein